MGYFLPITARLRHATSNGSEGAGQSCVTEQAAAVSGLPFLKVPVATPVKIYVLAFNVYELEIGAWRLW